MSANELIEADENSNGGNPKKSGVPYTELHFPLHQARIAITDEFSAIISVESVLWKAVHARIRPEDVVSVVLYREWDALALARHAVFGRRTHKHRRDEEIHPIRGLFERTLYHSKNASRQ
mgnify:CR=1 FL=1